MADRVELQVFRKWRTGPQILDDLRGLFSYGPGDDRATGALLGDGKTWPSSFAASGPLMLADLKSLLGVAFELVHFQAYRNGSGCGWHADTPFDAQAVLSLGATRGFGVRRPGADTTIHQLEHGDMVFMPSGFQKEWQHCVPEEGVKGERCSIVFRTVDRS